MPLVAISYTNCNINCDKLDEVLHYNQLNNLLQFTYKCNHSWIASDEIPQTFPIKNSMHKILKFQKAHVHSKELYHTLKQFAVT